MNIPEAFCESIYASILNDVTSLLPAGTGHLPRKSIAPKLKQFHALVRWFFFEKKHGSNFKPIYPNDISFPYDS